MPGEVTKVLGDTHSSRISSMIKDVIASTKVTDEGIELDISPIMLKTMLDLRAFLYDNVYRAPQVHNEFEKARKILFELYEYFLKNKDAFLRERKRLFEEEQVIENERTNYERHVCDFIAGMTDRYAQNLYNKIFMPSSVV